MHDVCREHRLSTETFFSDTRKDFAISKSFAVVCVLGRAGLSVIAQTFFSLCARLLQFDLWASLRSTLLLKRMGLLSVNSEIMGFAYLYRSYLRPHPRALLIYIIIILPELPLSSTFPPERQAMASV